MASRKPKGTAKPSRIYQPMHRHATLEDEHDLYPEPADYSAVGASGPSVNVYHDHDSLHDAPSHAYVLPERPSGSAYPPSPHPEYPDIPEPAYPLPPQEPFATDAPHPFVAELQGRPPVLPSAQPFQGPQNGDEFDDDEGTDYYDSEDSGSLPPTPLYGDGPRVRRTVEQSDSSEYEEDDVSEPDEALSDEEFINDDDKDVSLRRDKGRDSSAGLVQEVRRGHGRPRGSKRGGIGDRAGRPLPRGRLVKQVTTRIDRNHGLLPARRRPKRRQKKKMIDNAENEPRSWIGGPQGARAPLPPTSDFQILYSRASVAYIENRLAEAEDYLKQAVANNPEQYPGHSLLGEIYASTDRKEKAAMSFFMGAYSNHREQDVWKRTGDLIVDRLGLDDPDFREMAFYAYRQAVALDRNNIPLRKYSADLLRGANQLRKAAGNYRIILELVPCDFEALLAMGQICVKRKWPEYGIPFFNAALPDGHERDDGHFCQDLDFVHANLLADMHLKMGAAPQGLKEIKRFMRHLLGRGDHAVWDAVPDDSEFDAFDEPRRIHKPAFADSSLPPDTYGQGVPADLRMKMGIMRLRMGPEHLTEAMIHFEWFPTTEDDDDYISANPDVYQRIAGNLFATKHYHEAIEYYQALRRNPPVAPIHVKRLAMSLEEIGSLEEAEAIYLEIGGEDKSSMAHLAILAQIAIMYDKAGDTAKSEEFRQRLIRLDPNKPRLPKGSKLVPENYADPAQEDARKDPEEDGTGQGEEDDDYDDEDDDEDAIPLPKGDLPEFWQRQLERAGLTAVDRPDRPGKRKGRRWARRPFTDADPEDVRKLFSELELHDQSGVETASEDEEQQQWLETVDKLLTIFKKQKVFYPVHQTSLFWGYDSEAKERSRLLHPEQLALWRANKKKTKEGAGPEEVFQIPTDFCGIEFDVWFDVFLRSALMLSMRGETQRAYTVCDLLSSANVFSYDPLRMAAVRNVRLFSSIHADDDETTSYTAREYMKDAQFVGDAYRLSMASHLALSQPNMIWNASINQKYTLRQIKLMDSCFGGHVWNKTEMSSQPFWRRDADTGEVIRPTEMNAELLMMYAQMMFSGGSHTEALNYLHRVHALRPDDALVSLLMALSYVGWSFKRQSPNRHRLIMQGLSMFDHYRELRKKDRSPGTDQEVEFNLGRLFQNLGLLHLSVPCYERCLAMGERMQDDGDGFSREAAFALRGIWAINGQMEEAEKLTERWLVM